jgi:7-cyano-7-deazaguanine synthase
MTFRYGQRHQLEIEAAKKIAHRMEVKQHIIADIDLRTFGGSALTADIAVPKGREAQEMQRDIPITYVPARNTIFLSFALAWAEVLEASDVFIGVNAVDYSGYPDCRPEYIEAYERMANLATKAAVESRQKIKIHTPLISLTKAEIIARGLQLGVDYSLTISCYDPSENGEACGRCDACQLRRNGFQQNGLLDPVRYQQA